MKFLLIFIISFISISNSNIKDKKLIWKEIMELPPNLFYEENRESFQKRIEQGKFWVDQEEKILYLFINGDGEFGKRLFMLDEKLNLYIIHLSNNEEDGKDYMLYKYDRLKKTAVLIGTFKQCLFEK
ncbi:hypothetical protein [uncultured Akkermansia sp.]|uniref:hypothetical protein n=1 Tax=uncultured Akkermansia sp. TaxID=512294 RepID=UPI002628570D|nr:hypothetical protein [uncultured Akkermansia sp.]